MAGIDLIIERRYTEGRVAKLEQITWQHIPDPEIRWQYVQRRFRKPKLVEVDNNQVPDRRGRPLPEWCAPDYPPNRWLWIRASSPAADLGSVAQVDGVYPDDSPWWSYYDIPLRAGVVLLSQG